MVFCYGKTAAADFTKRPLAIDMKMAYNKEIQRYCGERDLFPVRRDGNDKEVKKMNFNNNKTKRIIAGIICGILVVAMIVPMVLGYLM